MTNTILCAVREMDDERLLSSTRSLSGEGQRLNARLVAHLAEIDERRLGQREGFPSTFAYAREVLGMSEGEAYLRIEAARIVRRFPLAIDLLFAGRVNLTALLLVGRHLTDDNHRAVLEETCGRTKEQVLAIVARLRPLPDVPPTIRKVTPAPTAARLAGKVPNDPGPRAASSAVPVPVPGAATVEAPAAPPVTFPVAAEAATETSSPSRSPVTPPLPLSPDRYKYALTIDGETRELLRAVKGLSGLDDATILKRALALFRKKIECEKFGLTGSPRTAPPAVDPESRYIPSAVRRDVATRDDLRCAFVSASGRRCVERAQLQFDHVKPYALSGGKQASNLRLLCKSHNAYEARRHFHIPEREAVPDSFWNG
jgi:hypothetical protein